MRLGLIACLFLAPCCPAWAQTAEESVAFLIANVEDGSEQYLSGYRPVLKKEKDNPLTYRGVLTEGPVLEVKTVVKQTSRCVFEVTSILVTRPNYQPKSEDDAGWKSRSAKIVVNMTKATQLTKQPRRESVIHANGACSIDVYDYDDKGQQVGQKCFSELSLPGNFVDGSRKQNAFNYLKSKYCESNAF